MKRWIALEVAVLIAALALFAGCAATNYQVKYPGAVSQLDGKAYEGLGIAQATLDAAKVEQGKGNLPASSIAIINRCGAAYNAARDSWLIYRDAVKAGKDSTSVGATLTTNLSLLNDAVLQVRAAIGGK